MQVAAVDHAGHDHRADEEGKAEQQCTGGETPIAHSDQVSGRL